MHGHGKMDRVEGSEWVIVRYQVAGHRHDHLGHQWHKRHHTRRRIGVEAGQSWDVYLTRPAFRADAIALVNSTRVSSLVTTRCSP